MATKYLYIDDETQEKSEGIVKSLLDENLIFKIERPKSWNDQKLQLIENKELNQYDGLLLDLKLEFSDGSKNEVKFNGADLAQTIRTDVKAGKINDLPIFLCSTDENFMSYFDKTSYDLFDRKYKKDVDFLNEDVKRQFFDFAKAYKTIREGNKVQNLLGKEVEENDDLVALQAELAKCQTPHEIVYLINHGVIQSNGLLLDEEVLCVRLGIDRENSADWEWLKDTVLSKFKYCGILSECYERWWQNDVLNWWREKVGKSLKVMSAKDRVTALSNIFDRSKITALTLPRHHRFDTFWYKCKLSKFPLEPSDALRTIEMPRYAWQESSYISMAYIMSEERSRQDIIAQLGANELKIFDELITNND